eukprot:gene19181-6474_t
MGINNVKCNSFAMWDFSPAVWLFKIEGTCVQVVEFGQCETACDTAKDERSSILEK